MDELKLDAAETIFFQRELEQISLENFDTKYAALKALQIVPLDTSVEATAETWTYTQFSKVGKAKRVTDYANDFPSVDLNGVQTSQKIVGFGDSFRYSIPEIRASAKLGRPLDRARAEAARAVLAQRLDDVMAIGDSTDLLGIANLTGTNSYSTPNGAAGTPGWTTKTPDEILKDMNGMISKVVVDSLEVHRPTRIVLPTSQYELIKSKARSATSDVTILKYFLDTNPGCEVMSWERLAGAGSAGSDRAIAYDPNPQLVRGLLPIPFEQMAPQPKNMAFVVNCHMRTGGVVAPFPKSICYADNI